MKLEVTVIESLTTALDTAMDEYQSSKGTDQENLYLFRMNFIKKFTDDVVFLNDLSGNGNFYHRYAYLIMRNMIEQFIEFLYINKNKELVDEYLGYSLNLDKLQRQKGIVAKERCFGEKRFEGHRAYISDMSKNIGEYKAPTGAMSLYDVYSILSEKCHNSYFGSLMDDFSKVTRGTSKIGLTDEHIKLIHIMVVCVLQEYSDNQR